MAFYNLPPIISSMMDAIDKRLTRLERAIRFSAPSVSTEPAHPTTADIIYNNTSGYLEYWDGTTWHIIADSNTAPPVIPFTSTWSGTGLAYTGTPAIGHYQKIGKQIHVQIKVSCTNVTNFGTGAYTLTLPTGLAPAYDYVLQGGLHSNASHYVLIGDLAISSTTIDLYYPTANGALDKMTGSKPKNLTTSDYFYVHGNYLIA